MKHPFDRVLAVSQLFILTAWALLGWLAFDWNPGIVLLVGFLGLWTFNVLVASGIRTFFKLMEPGISAAPEEALVDPIEFTDDDISDAIR